MKAIVGSILLFFFVGCFALPPCVHVDSSKWHNCKGKKFTSDGHSFEGTFVQGKPEGIVKHTTPDGSIYVGQFKNYRANGQGTLILTSGNKYVGEMRDGKRHGQGTNTWHNGDKYVGEYKDDKPHGQGTISFANGDKYVGEWNEGYINANSCGTVYLRSGHTEYCFRLEEGEILSTGIARLKAELEVKKIAKQKEEDEKVAKREEKRKKRLAEEKRKKKLAEEKRKEKEKQEKLARENDKTLYAVSTGTGFAVTNDGHIVTNNHVISGCQDVKIHNDERELRAKVMNRDSVNDIALIKAEFKPKYVFPLKSDNPKLLEDVFVGGYPFGRALSSSVKATKGVVSSLAGLGNNYSQLQIDAPLQPGNSGGPIIDTKGQVIGVAVAKLDLRKVLKDFGTMPDDVNFGIKSNVVVNFLTSNQINVKTRPQRYITRDIIAKQITDGTYLLSCWMTMAQVEKLKEQKVMFENLQ